MRFPVEIAEGSAVDGSFTGEFCGCNTIKGGVYGELVVKPLREADKALSSESANARISTWSAICARPRYFNRRVAAERSLNGDCPGYSGRTVTANINNDLASGKGTMADLERLNVYFRKVL